MKRFKIMTVALGISYFASFTGAMAPIAVARAEQKAPAVRTVTFAISGMITPNCPLLVKRAAKSIDGVEHVDASLEKKRAIVRYRSGVTSAEQIRRTIEDRTGFDAKIVSR